jgi:hypothetical protein
MLIRSDLLHRHLERHRNQAKKGSTASLPSPTKSLSSSYEGHNRNVRSLSIDGTPRSGLPERSPILLSPTHFAPSHVQTILPSTAQAPNGLQSQPCPLLMQSMVPNMSLHHEYAVPQSMYPQDMPSNSSNSPANGGIVIPASPNTLLDVNAKWDHLFQGGGIFEMNSLVAFDADFGNLTPPDFSVITRRRALIAA